MRVVLLATYELGRQPFGLASPAAWLRGAGFEVSPVDLSRDKLSLEALRDAGLIAVHLPMHTATRLALPVLQQIRAARPDVCLCAYGLYAPPNAELLRARGVDVVLGPEFEDDLLALARTVQHGGSARARAADNEARLPHAAGLAPATLPHLRFVTPDRRDLPALERYAGVRLPSGERRVAGYTEASRGCKHRCRHCPIVPVYDGRFRAIDADVVLADIAAQVEAGARHITFGDPDFFNGVRHALRIVERLAAQWPGVSYDVTIKIEHLLRHREALPVLRDTGCLFVTSAVEAIDDEVLRKLEKGHTRADFEEAVALMRRVGLTLAPTFVAFTPWTTLDGYAALLEALAALDLVEAVAPVQLGLRLLIPAGSRLLELPEIAQLVEPWDGAALVWPWRHPDPRVDALQHDVLRLVGRRVNAPRREVFERVVQLTESVLGRPLRLDVPPRPARVTVPYLTEPWYC